MTNSNRGCVDQALQLVRDGLRPFVEREFEAHYGTAWAAEAQKILDTQPYGELEGSNLDVSGLFVLILGRWDEVFRRRLREKGKRYVHELRDLRNQWAHQTAFTWDDALYVLTIGERLLKIIAAPEAQQIQSLKEQMRRLGFEEHEQSVGTVGADVSIQVTGTDVEQQLFALEHDLTRSPAEVDRIRIELAVRLNEKEISFGAEDEMLLIGTGIRPSDLSRPAIGASGGATLTIARLPQVQESFRFEVAGPVRSEQHPFGLLYPRWQSPNCAGGTITVMSDWGVSIEGPDTSEEAATAFTPFVILEHPLPHTWIATTAPPRQEDGQLRWGREYFNYDASTRTWRRKVVEFGLEPEALVVPNFSGSKDLPTQELNKLLDRWIDRWASTIDDYM